MPITGKFFPGQKSEEKVFLLLRRHWISYGIFIFLFIMMLVPLFIFLIISMSSVAVSSPEIINIIYLILPAYLLVMLGLMLYGFVDYYLDVYIVTNERIVSITQNGFFRRDISELHLHQVQDVSAKEEGIFPTLFHYGDVIIQTAGERENFVFKLVPHPYSISKKIVDLHEAQLEESQREELELGKGDFTESLRPDVLSLARKRTKEFFKGSEPLDIGVSPEDIKTMFEKNSNDTILGGLENMQNSKFEEPLRRESESESYQDNANTPITQKPEIQAKEDKNNKPKEDEVELHENEEIDL